MPLVSKFRYGCALVFVALMLAAPRAEAELVTHTFTGQLTTITNGSGVTADLTGLFTLGQAVTLEYTIERTTPPTQQDANTSAYTDAITALSFTIGTWTGSGNPTSVTTVTDNAPYDQYSAQIISGITAPPLGSAMYSSMTYTLDDIQGTVFSSTALPRVFPDLGVFDGKTVTVLLFDFTQLKSGYVMATLAGVATPTHPTTWGSVKALYR
jgi:hypothetical protein